MAEIFFLNVEPPASAPVFGLPTSAIHHPSSLVALISSLFQKGNSEQDIDHIVMVILDPTSTHGAGRTELDRLSCEYTTLLLRYFFCHLNLVVVDVNALKSGNNATVLKSAVDKANLVLKDRISRVATWTGTGGFNVNDFFGDVALGVDHKQSLAMSDVISTMSSMLDHNGNKTPVIEAKLKHLLHLIVSHVDFKLLLEDHSDAHLAKLCHYVGHWSFPAHELSNDDLVYCVFLILRHAIEFAESQGETEFLTSSNELLALVFMVRDTYNNGNPFHNFRHAVDVLQACFHFLLRMKCLPEFLQFELDPHTNEESYFKGIKTAYDSVTLVATPSVELENDSSVPHLNARQTLALLVAALGHDVGHPGVTNAFMIKNNAPTSQIFSERSVLELYHSSVFINKILRINAPYLLEQSAGPESKLTMKNLIIGSILATDMAEHFEYINKLKTFGQYSSNDEKVTLISSLLIKCADISNVTRPLRVSSQWALVLSREFEEVDVLDKLVSTNNKVNLSVKYPKLAYSLDDILNTNPYIHKGQIFFILTFAEGLFRSILELLPELCFTCDIIKENKSFWMKRNQMTA